MTAPDPETVEAVGYENADGTLYGYANHKSYERNPGSVPVRIVRERDWQAMRDALTASEKRVQELTTWIDCRERPPGHDGFVLVWHKGYAHIACRSQGEAHDWYSIANTWLKKDDVDCWMPIPGDPK